MLIFCLECFRESISVFVKKMNVFDKINRFYRGPKTQKLNKSKAENKHECPAR